LREIPDGLAVLQNRINPLIFKPIRELPEHRENVTAAPFKTPPIFPANAAQESQNLQVLQHSV
jgi:hypothetical protein